MSVSSWLRFALFHDYVEILSAYIFAYTCDWYYCDKLERALNKAAVANFKISQHLHIGADNNRTYFFQNCWYPVRDSRPGLPEK
jgi:hypothetical protein